jgi:hypothetical protein
MSDPYKTYRVCCYDAALNVVTSDFIEAANDEEAVAKATTAGFGSKGEVWDGHRLVAQLEAERQAG